MAGIRTREEMGKSKESGVVLWLACLLLGRTQLLEEDRGGRLEREGRY
jgi:hypothetical protein